MDSQSNLRRRTSNTENIWNNSLYTLSGSSTGPTETRRNSLVSIFNDVFETEQSCEDKLNRFEESAIISYPPSRNVIKLNQENHELGEADEDEYDFIYDENDDEDDDVLELHEVALRDDSTLFGRLLNNAAPEMIPKISSTENRQQFRFASKVFDEISSPPLSKVLSYLTEAFFICVFLTNLVLAIYDIATAATNLHYKLPNLFIGSAETIIVFSMGIVLKCRLKLNKGAELSEKGEKRKQYTENIMTELFLYPVIILSTLGFFNDKLYKPANAMAWFSNVLLLIDCLDFVWNQVMRLKMFYTFMIDIYKFLNDINNNDEMKFKLSFCGYILPRAYFTVLGNSLMFLLLITMMGLQMNKDNLTSSDYGLSYQSGLIMACMIIFPSLSFLLFILSNSVWMTEVLLMINLKFKDGGQLKEDYKGLIDDATTLAVLDFDNIQKTLNYIRSLSTFHKVGHALFDIWILIPIIMWSAIWITAAVIFDGLETYWINLAIKITFILLVIIINFHLSLISITCVIAVPLFIIVISTYPLTIMILFWKKERITPK